MRLPPIVGCCVFLAAACGVTEPKTRPTTPTLLVTNATCDPGPCTGFDVRGWESVWPVPGQPPGGFLQIGQVTSATACLQFPAIVKFTVTERDSAGHWVRADSTFWTPKNSVGLTALALGSGFRSFPFAYADSEIVPASSPGWQVTFPSGDISPAQPCQP